MTEFKNPYRLAKETKRFHVKIPEDEVNFVLGIHPDNGTIAATVGLLWQALKVELINRGIKSQNDRFAFETLLTNLRITMPETLPYDPQRPNNAHSGGLPHGTTSGTMSPTSRENDNRPMSPTSDRNTTNAPFSSIVQGGSGKGGESKGNKPFAGKKTKGNEGV